jgi:hypothetical protein
MNTNTTNTTKRPRGRPRKFVSGEVLRFWLDVAARERMDELQRQFEATLGVKVSRSAIARAALKTLADRAEAVASLGSGADTFAALALRSDLALAADGRDRA